MSTEHAVVARLVALTSSLSPDGAPLVLIDVNNGEAALLLTSSMAMNIGALLIRESALADHLTEPPPEEGDVWAHVVTEAPATSEEANGGDA